jgi:hypothetical protein
LALWAVITVFTFVTGISLDLDDATLLENRVGGANFDAVTTAAAFGDDDFHCHDVLLDLGTEY